MSGICKHGPAPHLQRDGTGAMLKRKEREPGEASWADRMIVLAAGSTRRLQLSSEKISP